MNCPSCNSKNLIKKGTQNGKQRFQCKACGYKTVNPVYIRNVLIIGDLHEPFCLDGYLEFNIGLYKKYDITDVIFIGDVIDNHFSSYHETDPDGMGGGDELDAAIAKLSRWYKAFPKATVTLGNHDLLLARKAFSSKVPSRWIKDYSDVLQTPNWKFVSDIVLDNVWYRHGVGTKAATKTGREMSSVVQGHFHTEAYVVWKVGRTFKTFGMQVGCGVDFRAYAMAYARSFPKPIISSGLVLDNGKLAFVETMDI